MDVLKQIIDYLKKHKVKIVLAILAAFLFPLLIIHLLYSFPIPLLQSHWSAGDLLGYVASFFATLGTLILGFIAIKQSQIINELNIKANEPYLVYRCDLYDYYFTLLVKNKSENIARSLILTNASLFPKQKNAKKNRTKI